MRVLNREKDAALDNRKSQLKRTYSTPQVIKYGTVMQLTQGMNGSTLDPRHNTNTKKGLGIG